MSRLWYRKPAAVWEEALPLGNGRLGAMVFGNPEGERIQVNEESVWYGGKKDRINPDAKEQLPAVRKLIREGRIREAQELMGTALTGCPNSENPYQTLGDIKIYFKHIGMTPDAAESPDMASPSFEPKELGYERSLSLWEGVCRVNYCLGGVRYQREHFISKPADAMIMRFSASEKEKISFTLRLERWYFFKGVKKTFEGGQADGVLLYGRPGEDGHAFVMMAKCRVTGGSRRVLGESLIVEDADEAVLYFGAVTDYRNPGASYEALEKQLCGHLESVGKREYDSLLKEHIADHRALFDRVELKLGNAESGKASDLEALATDERLRLAAEGGEDPGLQKLLFDYGRYLMIAGSREGTLPTTLQGLWNQDFMPPWGAKYTININTEMNYWPAEVCGLPECHLPLFELLKIMLPDGRRTAREMYGCRGFVAHHNTDIHGDCAPQDLWLPATYWPMGAAWLCTHLWTHYLYTPDKKFLREAFPLMAESALFFVDFLEPWGEYLVTNPSCSPENTYILPGGERGCVCLGPTMDNQILRDLFTACLDSYDILCEETREGSGEAADRKENAGAGRTGRMADIPAGIGIPGVSSLPELMREIREIREKLAPTKIGSDGRIMEWLEEYEEAEPGHRHISQLYGLFPSDQITSDGTPELAAAAAKTLETRLSHGGGHTGWSRAWIMNHYAKLWDGDKACENIRKMLADSTYPNLFDKHPPFQIDGNFGASAAIANMLVQSNRERVVLLPALPGAWDSGEVRGLRLVGGARVTVAWEKGELTSCSIRADGDYRATVKYGEKQWQVELAAGQTAQLAP